ncbi:MAG: CHAP domain-containing protein [Flavobacterium sp.]|uniref:CHAP domain-containing protein n=1 Tax=Flavobacterium sp. TaxID=239 RepID=UPI002B45FF96|nr:CHAP domain-containing protein [Flavobacterium sp.]WRH73541.1 MAG: CHAP domain-containing protein [Flavobacterium sp.]
MKNRLKKILLSLTIISVMLLVVIAVFDNKYYIGKKIDSFNNVSVYYNGNPKNVNGRNLTKDGYNLGLNYQCVEFVKRYYYEYLNHKMPNSYGHAKDFYDRETLDGELNNSRNLIQFNNPSFSKPKVNDILVLDKSIFNKFGHVSIVSRVNDNSIEVVQQNVFLNSREDYDLIFIDGKWKVDNERILCWLRME